MEQLIYFKKSELQLIPCIQVTKQKTLCFIVVLTTNARSFDFNHNITSIAIWLLHIADILPELLHSGYIQNALEVHMFQGTINKGYNYIFI